MPSVPGTLAFKVREKFPGAYDDLDDAALEAAVTAKHPGVYDDIPRSTLPKRPISAEDFTDPTAGIQSPTLGGYLSKTAGSVANMVKGLIATGMDTRPEDEALGPMAAVAPFARAAVSGAKAELDKAIESAGRGRYSEFAGHTAAAALPLIGPASAAAGERFGSGDVEGGLADATTLLAPMAAAKVAPRVAAPLASIGEQLASKGKALPPVAVEVAKHLPFGIGTGVKAVSAAAKIASKLADLVGDESAAPETGRLARDAAGAPVKAPTLAQMLADSLADLNKPEPPARVTTAPEPSLPPGYTPRATAKLPKQVAERIAARKASAGTIGPRNYFLKPKAETVAVEEPAAAPANVDVADLPASWRGRTGPEPIPARGAVGQQDAAEAAQILRERGMSIGEAVMRVSKNTALPTDVRLQLIDAIKKSAKIPAEVR